MESIQRLAPDERLGSLGPRGGEDRGADWAYDPTSGTSWAIDKARVTTRIALHAYQSTNSSFVNVCHLVLRSWLPASLSQTHSIAPLVTCTLPLL
jgi:hypothetical protein